MQEQPSFTCLGCKSSRVNDSRTRVVAPFSTASTARHVFRSCACACKRTRSATLRDRCCSFVVWGTADQFASLVPELILWRAAFEVFFDEIHRPGQGASPKCWTEISERLPEPTWCRAESRRAVWPTKHHTVRVAEPVLEVGDQNESVMRQLIDHHGAGEPLCAGAERRARIGLDDRESAARTDDPMQRREQCGTFDAEIAVHEPHQDGIATVEGQP